jgi:hypothetical protein
LLLLPSPYLPLCLPTHTTLVLYQTSKWVVLHSLFSSFCLCLSRSHSRASAGSAILVSSTALETETKGTQWWVPKCAAGCVLSSKIRISSHLFCRFVVASFFLSAFPNCGFQHNTYVAF